MPGLRRAVALNGNPFAILGRPTSSHKAACPFTAHAALPPGPREEARQG